MKIEVVTLFPRMIAGALEFGVVGRAVERGLLRVGTEDPREAAARLSQVSVPWFSMRTAYEKTKRRARGTD